LRVSSVTVRSGDKVTLRDLLNIEVGEDKRESAWGSWKWGELSQEWFLNQM